MSKNFVPSWLNLENQLEKSTVSNKNNEVIENKEELKNDECYKWFNSTESLEKFLKLCGLRPCYESKEYMDWYKENQIKIENNPNYKAWKKLYDNLFPVPNNEVDYKIYEKSEENFYDSINDKYDTEEEEVEYCNSYEIDQFVNNMNLNDEYEDEYYNSPSDDETSEEDDADDYYDYRFNKYYL